MLFRHPKADLFIPDQCDPAQAFSRVTHLGIVSHQDDLEIAAYHGIADCFRSESKWFGGIVVTDGGGSPRKGAYEKYTDEQMQQVRQQEQRKAAFVGEYSVMVQLGYPSDDLKNARKTDVTADILKILTLTKPQLLAMLATGKVGAVEHDGDLGVLARLLAVLDQPDVNFPIVTP